MNPQQYSLLMTKVWLQGKIPLLSEPHNLCHLRQIQPGGRGSNSQIPIFSDLSIRSRKPGAGCVPVLTAQRSHTKQCRTAAAWMSPSWSPHIILLGSTTSHTHNDSNHLYHTEKGKGRQVAVLPWAWGRRFGAGDASTGCALLPALSISWTLQANQNGHISSDCCKWELGLHYLVELAMKSSISVYPRAHEHSTYQSLANCLLLRSKNQLCVFVTPVLDWWEKGPQGRESIFQGRSF